MSDTKHTPNPPTGLARMMRLGSGVREIWEPADLAAVLRHQLDAPLRAELAALGFGSAKVLHTICETEGKGITTFADLFFHPAPPLELLQMTKRYAKLCRRDRQSPLPQDIAMLLYFMTIAAALCRCGQRISNMDDAALRKGMGWFTQQGWVDERVRGLLADGLTKLGV